MSEDKDYIPLKNGFNKIFSDAYKRSPDPDYRARFYDAFMEKNHDVVVAALEKWRDETLSASEKEQCEAAIKDLRFIREFLPKDDQ